MTGYITQNRILKLGLAQPDLDDWKGWSTTVAGTGDSNTTYTILLPTGSTFPDLAHIYVFLGFKKSPYKTTGKRFFFQPMDKTLRNSGCVHEGAYSDMLGMKAIPRVAETIAAYTILEMARFLQVPVHFKQVTCGETLELIRTARKNGLDVTCGFPRVQKEPL